MKTSSMVLFALFALFGTAVASAQQVDLRSAVGGNFEPFTIASAAGGACDSSVPGIIIHDDGEGENGYSFNAETVTDGRIVDKFTPAAYPATFTSACFAFITNKGVSELPFDIVVYDDDGDNGMPGTLLGSVSATAHPAALSDVPFTPAFESYDISGMALDIASGSVYVGVEWAPSAAVDGVFLAADESTATPLAGGYFWANEDPWVPTSDPYEDYRAMMIRAVGAMAEPGPPSISKSFSPVQVAANDPSTLTITLSNVSQPDDAAELTADFTDTFPAGLILAATPSAATTCIDGSVTTTNGSVTLEAGAKIPAADSCTVTVDVTSATEDTYENTIAAGTLVTDLGDNENPASADLEVGFTFPEPYCPTSYAPDVSPVSNVNFAGIDNDSDPANNQSPALEDFTATLGSVGVGQSYEMSVQGNTDGANAGIVTVYIDWNQNGDFNDDGETYSIGALYNSTGTDGQKALGNIAVPLDAVPGETRMRVTKSNASAADACGVNDSGQAEDYTLTVVGLGPEPSVSKSFAPTQVGVDAPSTLTLVLDNTRESSISTLTTELVDSFPANLVVADTPNASTTCGNATLSVVAGDSSVTVPSGTTIAAGESCDVKVDVQSASEGMYDNVIPAGELVTDQGGSSPLPAEATLQVGFTFPEPYCEIDFPSSVEPITRVVFDGIDNSSDPAIDGSPALENFTSIIGSVAQADTVSMAVEGNSNGSFTTVIAAYVDWNQDGDFDDADETYAIGEIAGSNGTDGQQAVADIAVPATAKLGQTRMRVTKKFLNAAGACNDSGYGQAEDYTLTVTKAMPKLSKSFAPDSIAAGEPSVATISLINPTPNVATLTADLIDEFPAGLQILSATTTCGIIIDDDQLAAASSPSVTLPTGTPIPANGSCDLVVNVTGSTSGEFTNTLAAGALQTDQGDNTDPASATLTVMVAPVATVTPTELNFSLATDETQDQTLNIANAAGSDPLTFSIAARGSDDVRFHLRPTDRQVKRAANFYAKHPPSLAASNSSTDGVALEAPAWMPPTPAAGGPLVFMYDDGSAENAIGLGLEGPPATESMAIFFDRFTPPEGTGAYTITTVSILWPDVDFANGDMVGLQPNLVFYYDLDSDGDPSNAIRLGADTLVTIGTTGEFEDYPVSISVPGDGDVYVGFADQWAEAGDYTPRLFPAAIDEDTSAGMSYLSGASKGITDLTDLSNNDLSGTIESLGLSGNFMIRAVGAADGSGDLCTGPAVAWLAASPADGSVDGGDNTDVTVTADPAAGGLATGSYDAAICITTNDPDQSVIAIPVTMEVTVADAIFCDGFEEGGDGSCDDTGTPVTSGNIVASGALDLDLPATFNGIYVNWLTGATCSGDNPCDGQFNVYANHAGELSFLWPRSDQASAGVNASAGASYAVLHSGATIGPAARWSSRTGADFSNWRSGVDGYLGFAFQCPSATTLAATTCYGYAHIVTSKDGPNRLLEYWYDASGAAITIP